VIDHAPEGRTEQVSALRGNPVASAAKCIILMVKLGKKHTKYVLAVVPGDSRVDFNAVRAVFGGTYIAFAGADVAEELAACPLGTVLPFALDPRVEVIVDPALRNHEEIFFNAARLDRSVAIKFADYARIATPRFERISTAATT
jgi:Ala-tRNA(Pro) deacylase